MREYHITPDGAVRVVAGGELAATIPAADFHRLHAVLVHGGGALRLDERRGATPPIRLVPTGEEGRDALL